MAKNVGGGGMKNLTMSQGEGPKNADPQFSYFVAPLPVINDRSLTCQPWII